MNIFSSLIPKLCLLCSFDFETDQNKQQPFDSIGFLQCLHGPCALYRSVRLGSLTEGMAEQYFSLIKEETRDLVFGNVKLAEDRIPSNLLVFQQSAQGQGQPDKNGRGDTMSTSEFSSSSSSSLSLSLPLLQSDSYGVSNNSSSAREEGGYFYTGFVRDAVFYFEAEKP